MTSLIKDKFISHLSNGNSSTDLDKYNLSEIPNSEFIEVATIEDGNTTFDDRMWNSDYFYSQLSKIKLKEFSKERCNHLIDVKIYLQKKNIKGFALDSKESLDNKPINNVFNPEENINSNSNININHMNQEQIDSILTGYIPKERLLNAISENDRHGIQRNIEFDLINNRQTTEDILKTILYVNKNTSEVFIPYNTDEFCLAIDENSEHWDKDYFTIQQSYLNHNFSLERLLHLVNVKQHLADNKVDGFEFIKVQPKKNVEQNDQQNKNSERKSNVRQDVHKTQDKGILKTAVMIGGAVLAGIIALIALTR